MSASVSPTPEGIRHAADLLLKGGVVILPTETVYGLAANAMDEAAITRVFTIKGRPANHPLIVHLASAKDLDRVAQDIPELALQLAAQFWPGPLTLVLRKRDELPNAVTGGRPTVAVRVPAHSVTLAVLKAAGCPVAAPSANRFTRLSPTRVEDLDPEVVRQADAVLDGGPCEVGIESTVLDLTRETPVILRLGGLSRTDLEQVLGGPIPFKGSEAGSAPGTHAAHYQPRGQVLVVAQMTPDMPGIVLACPSDCQIELGTEPESYQKRLFAALSEMDRRGAPVIHVQAPPKTAEWEAVWDRLLRASHAE